MLEFRRPPVMVSGWGPWEVTAGTTALTGRPSELPCPSCHVRIQREGGHLWTEAGPHQTQPASRTVRNECLWCAAVPAQTDGDQGPGGAGREHLARSLSTGEDGPQGQEGRGGVMVRRCGGPVLSGRCHTRPTRPACSPAPPRAPCPGGPCVPGAESGPDDPWFHASLNIWTPCCNICCHL